MNKKRKRLPPLARCVLADDSIELHAVRTRPRQDRPANSVRDRLDRWIDCLVRGKLDHDHDIDALRDLLEDCAAYLDACVAPVGAAYEQAEPRTDEEGALFALWRAIQ